MIPTKPEAQLRRVRLLTGTIVGQDRNHASAPDRNTSSGPIGINSDGISSLESSSSSSADEAQTISRWAVGPRQCVSVTPEKENDEAETKSGEFRDYERTAEWDRRKTITSNNWAEILNCRGIAEPEIICVLSARLHRKVQSVGCCAWIRARHSGFTGGGRYGRRSPPFWNQRWADGPTYPDIQWMGFFLKVLLSHRPRASYHVRRSGWSW